MIRSFIILVFIVLFSTITFADTNEVKLKGYIEKVLARQNLNAVVTVKEIEKIDNTNFSVYSVYIQPENNPPATQYLIFNGQYLSSDLVDIENHGSVIENAQFNNSNLEVDLSKFTLIAGNPKAKNYIVEVSDFECPYCYAAYSYMKEAMADNKDIAIYIAHYPIEGRKNSPIFAKIFEAGMMQGKDFSKEIFESMQSKAFSGMSHDEIVEHFAKQTKNAKKFKKDVESKKVANIILDGQTLASKIDGMSGTPAIIINGKVIQGFNKPLIERTINNIK